MLVAIVPGTFDPITAGHLDVIQRAAAIFDRVVVGVASSPAKTPLFSIEERVQMIKEAVSGLARVSVESFDELLVTFATRHRAKIIIKGLRAVSDFEHEIQMAQLNRKLAPATETVFIMANPEYAYLSSSAVKEIAKYGGNINGLVPANVEPKLREAYS